LNELELGINDAVATRRFSPIRETPLIVPSFSSLVSREIGAVLRSLKGKLGKACLVSALDVSEGLIHIGDLQYPELLFVDSGNYEFADWDRSKKTKTWSPKKHGKAIKILVSSRESFDGPSREIVLVNYDIKAPISRQVLLASELFHRHPQTIHDFLCKPERKGSHIVPVKRLLDQSSKLQDFDVLGLVEKELGRTPLEKCKTLVAIRKGLLGKGFNKPIHIFGCSDPLGIVTYFLCGADIFDGTSWLRMGFHEDMAIYEQNYFLLRNYWTQGVDMARGGEFTANLDALTSLQHDMQQFSETHDVKSFRMRPMSLAAVQTLVSHAGIRF